MDKRRSRRLLGLHPREEEEEDEKPDRLLKPSPFKMSRPPPLDVGNQNTEYDVHAELTHMGAYVVGDCQIDGNGYRLGSGSSSKGSKASSGMDCDADEESVTPIGGVHVEGLSDLIVFQDICGQGSSGRVRIALHKPSGQIVALKEVSLDLSHDKSESIVSELKALHESSSPNIVSFHGAFYRDSTISLVMEYMDAGSLCDLCKACENNAIPEFYLAQIARQLLTGLTYLHSSCRIIHRDIKPSNILINSNGDVKIADFGVSGRLGRHVHNKDTFVGTVHYMSPERVLGQKHSFDSDVWSVGFTLMECALGHYPRGQVKPRSAFWDVMDSATQQPMPELPTGRFSDSFRSFVYSCVRKSPNQRPAANKLLRHPFITQSECSRASLQKFIAEVKMADVPMEVQLTKARYLEKQRNSRFAFPNNESE